MSKSGFTDFSYKIRFYGFFLQNPVLRIFLTKSGFTDFFIKSGHGFYSYDMTVL